MADDTPDEVIRDTLRRVRTIAVVGASAAECARRAGLAVIMDRCPVIEWGRLGMTRQ
jgi:hypothetical protein